MRLHLFGILLSFMLLVSLHGFAGEYGHAQYDRIQKAHANGTEFLQLNLFTQINIKQSIDVRQYITLLPDNSNIQKLYQNRYQAVTLTLKVPGGYSYTLELVESHPLSEEPDMGYIDNSGRYNAEYEPGLHYQGAIKGLQQSIATMSVFADGEVMIFFSNKDGNFNLGRMKDSSGRYVLYNSKDRTEVMSFTCLTKDDGAHMPQNRSEHKTTGAIECKKVRVYWECNYGYYQFKGNLASAQNYAITLFNQMQGIYYNDGVAVEMSSLYIWTMQDWYYNQTTSTALSTFFGYWSAQDSSFKGDQGHLIAMGSPNGWQGFAYMGSLCNNQKYAASQLFGSYTGFPNYDWDIYVVAHETGHSIGAAHSHSCAWNTGPGGTCGSIDNCGTQEAGIGCPTCPFLYDVNSPGWQATVMSYCGTYINFSAGFGPVIAAFLRDTVSKYPCLRPVINPRLTAKEICNNDGAITLSYQPNNFGVAPYTYLWSSGQQTKDINGLSTPGNYTVTITDSNNCTITQSAELKQFGKSGNGQALTYSMPLCCKDTSFTVTLNTSLPVALSACQSVAWLRTSTPITSYQQAKTAYINAGTGDILKSDNDSVISNSRFAELTIKSPDSCNKIEAYYYTPFITRKAKNKSVYTANSTNPQPIKAFATIIGSVVTINDQNSQLNICDQSDTVASDTITVIISSYTGRSNNLCIRITGVDHEELHRKIDYAGNGTYAIPITNTNNHLQRINVRAYDNNLVNGAWVASSVNIHATRKVTYAAIPPLTFDTGCVAGTSVFLSFGPDSCDLRISRLDKKLSRVSLHPNPARGSARVEFHADNAGAGTINVTDMLGKIMDVYPVYYRTGNNSILLNVAAYSSGMYFVALSDKEGSVYNMKLVIK